MYPGISQMSIPETGKTGPKTQCLCICSIKKPQLVRKAQAAAGSPEIVYLAAVGTVTSRIHFFEKKRIEQTTVLQIKSLLRHR